MQHLVHVTYLFTLRIIRELMTLHTTATLTHPHAQAHTHTHTHTHAQAHTPTHTHTQIKPKEKAKDTYLLLFLNPQQVSQLGASQLPVLGLGFLALRLLTVHPNCSAALPRHHRHVWRRVLKHQTDVWEKAVISCTVGILTIALPLLAMTAMSDIRSQSTRQIYEKKLYFLCVRIVIIALPFLTKIAMSDIRSQSTRKSLEEKLLFCRYCWYPCENIQTKDILPSSLW